MLLPSLITEAVTQPLTFVLPPDRQSRAPSPEHPSRRPSSKRLGTESFRGTGFVARQVDAHRRCGRASVPTRPLPRSYHTLRHRWPSFAVNALSRMAPCFIHRAGGGRMTPRRVGGENPRALRVGCACSLRASHWAEPRMGGRRRGGPSLYRTAIGAISCPWRAQLEGETARDPRAEAEQLRMVGLVLLQGGRRSWGELVAVALTRKAEMSSQEPIRRSVLCF